MVTRLAYLLALGLLDMVAGERVEAGDDLLVGALVLPYRACDGGMGWDGESSNQLARRRLWQTTANGNAGNNIKRHVNGCPRTALAQWRGDIRIRAMSGQRL
jgi:hypothetical protein